MLDFKKVKKNLLSQYKKGFKDLEQKTHLKSEILFSPDKRNCHISITLYKL